MRLDDSKRCKIATVYLAIMHLTELRYPDTALGGQAGADVSAALVDLKAKAAALCFGSQQDALNYASHGIKGRACGLS